MASGQTSILPIDICALGTQLASNANLNSITTIGRYFSVDGAQTNAPHAGKPFDMIVMYRASSSRIWQIVFAYDSSDPELFYRAQSGASSFTSWKKVTVT